VKFFDSSKAINKSIAPCVVKQACKQLASLATKGMLNEEVTNAEMEFAAKGDISRRAYTHSLCKTCDQDLCPVWKMVHNKELPRV
jgi:hypothetical protein